MTRDKFSINASNYSGRRTLNVSSFSGVDYQKAETNVADDHSVDSLNLIFKDGVIQTRDGYEQVAKADTHINAIWSFIAEDGDKHVVAHIGTHLYEVKNISNFLKSSFTLISQYELEDYKSCAFVDSKKLYILGGNKYLVLSITGNSYSLNEVEDNAYIPTTTTAITYQDSSASGAQALDDVNLLTQWRKNKLVSGTYVDDGATARTTRFWQWELDTSVKAKTKANLNNLEIVVNQLRKAA